jgi:hypothetical protein
LNSTFISLIPKVFGAAKLKDFRPISLVSGIYKIISKVLANRLRLVLSRIISTPQNAFVEGTLSQLEVEISPEEHIV